MLEKETVATPAPSEVKTERHYAELSTEDIRGMSDEKADNYARQQGWVPAEEFRGDKSKAKSAKDFMIDGKDELPIMRSNLRKQTDKVEALTKTLTDTTKQFTTAMKKQEEKHKKDLERQIKQSESKRDKAKADFDIDTATKEAENVVTLKNELDTIEDTSKQVELTQEQNYQQKSNEWATWQRTQEAYEMTVQDPAKFKRFEGAVAEVFQANPNLSTQEIIAEAKDKVYTKASAPNLQGANPSKSQKTSSKLSSSQKHTVLGNIDAEVFLLKKKGITKEAETKYRKEKFAEYEELLTQGE